MSSTPLRSGFIQTDFGYGFVSDIEGAYEAQNNCRKMPDSAKVAIVSASAFLTCGIASLVCLGKNCFKGLSNEEICLPNCNSDTQVWLGVITVIGLLGILISGIYCCAKK